ncbi:MAG: hypothetical protein ACOC80_09270 [Petrotogales bacterium]
MQNNIWKKSLVVAVICLFIGLAFAPSINANINAKPTEDITAVGKGRLVKLGVTEFKPNGTTEKTIVKMTFEEAKELKNKLKDIKSSDERLSLYKEYGLIPEDVTLEKLKAGMKEKAKRNGLTEEELAQLNGPLHIFPSLIFHARNKYCYVSGENNLGLRLILGLSAFTRIINWFIWNFLQKNLVPSIDLLNTQIGLGVGVNAKNGHLPNIGFFGPGITMMLGFVGFYINAFPLFGPHFLPFLVAWDSWFGYAAYVGVTGYDLDWPW